MANLNLDISLARPSRSLFRFDPQRIVLKINSPANYLSSLRPFVLSLSQLR